MKHFKETATDLRNFDLEPAKYLNLGLASWLMISAFAWWHSETQFLLTIFVGAVVATIAPFEIGILRARTITAVAGLALVLGAVALPRTTTLTLWHNALIGLAIMGIAFFGPPHGRMRERPLATDEYDSMGMWESGAPPMRQVRSAIRSARRGVPST